MDRYDTGTQAIEAEDGKEEEESEEQRISKVDSKKKRSKEANENVCRVLPRCMPA